MTLTINWNTVFSAVSTVLAISGWATVWRRSAVAEGKLRAEVESIREELERVKSKEEYLRGCQEESSGVLREVSTDMSWVKKALARIEDMLSKQGRDRE